MLIIELDLARITASQGGYRERGTMQGVALARQVRSMRIALAALALYMAPLKTMRIVWIGAEVDAAAAEQDLMNQTANWTDWDGISSPYAHWLTTECRRHLPHQT